MTETQIAHQLGTTTRTGRIAATATDAYNWILDIAEQISWGDPVSAGRVIVEPLTKLGAAINTPEAAAAFTAGWNA